MTPRARLALVAAATVAVGLTACAGTTTIESSHHESRGVTTTVGDTGNELVRKVVPPDAAVEPPAGSTNTTLPRGGRSASGDPVKADGPLQPTVTGVDRSGADPPILVLGDNLVRALGGAADGATHLATRIREATGRSTTVIATGNAGFAQLADPTLGREAQPPARRMPTAADSVAQVKPQLTVLAVGSADARTLQANNGMDGGYLIGHLDGAVRAVLAGVFAGSGCVVIVNVAQDSGWGRMGGWAKATNELLALIDSGDDRITIADWNAASTDQDWFVRRDIRHNEAGEAAYEKLIIDTTVARLTRC